MSAAVLHLRPENPRLNSYAFPTSFEHSVEVTDSSSLSSSPSDTHSDDSSNDFPVESANDPSFFGNDTSRDKLSSKHEEISPPLADIAQRYLNDQKKVSSYDDKSSGKQHTHSLNEINNRKQSLLYNIDISVNTPPKSNSCQTQHGLTTVNSESVDDDLLDFLLSSQNVTDSYKKDFSEQVQLDVNSSKNLPKRIDLDVTSFKNCSKYDLSEKDESDIASFIDSLDGSNPTEVQLNLYPLSIISADIPVEVEKNSSEYDEGYFSEKLASEVNLNECIKKQTASKDPVLPSCLTSILDNCSAPLPIVSYYGFKTHDNRVANNEIKKTSIVRSRGSLFGKALSCRMNERSNEKILNIKNALYEKYFCSGTSDICPEQTHKTVINKSNQSILSAGRFHYPNPPTDSEDMLLHFTYDE